MTHLGIDLGGANLKFSNGKKSFSRPFPLWKQPQLLPDCLERSAREFDRPDVIAVTMTGELADCFRTRAEGVTHILQAVQQVFHRQRVGVWQTGGEFFALEQACEFPELVAAANWHALATWAGRACSVGGGLLIDIGSTTTDLIPLEDGLPMPTGRTDLERLSSGELVYTGFRRTPVCSLTDAIELRGCSIRPAAELFATTLDVGLVLGEIDEDAEHRETANGRPATRAEALVRLARVVCSDRDQLTDDEIRSMARQLRNRQLGLLSQSMHRVLGRMNSPLSMVITSGEGESLAQSLVKALDVQQLSLAQLLGREHSAAACAYALSMLAAELM